MLRLLIKAPSLRAAREAARVHGLRLVEAWRTTDRPTVGAVARYTVENLCAAQRWFGAPGRLAPGTGYPDGTLLHFGYGS